jgi:lysozyme family protein
MSERFIEFFRQLLINEGNYSDDPLDSGGKTIYGISYNNYPKAFDLTYSLYIDGKKELAKNAAMHFYYDKFYNKLYDDIKNIVLAFRLFDFGVNAGVHEAVKLLQEVLNELGCNLTVDGVFGQNTLRMANTYNCYDAYVNRLERFYISLNKPKWIKGWLKRLKRKFIE